MTAHKLFGLALGLLMLTVLIVGQRWMNSEVARYVREQKVRRG